MEVRRSPLSQGARATIASTVGLAVVAAAMVVPLFWDRDVRVHWPPLHADWGPRLKPELALVVVVGLALWMLIPAVAARASWAATVVVSTAGSWLWTMVLALYDGRYGLSRVYERVGEYLYDV